MTERWLSAGLFLVAAAVLLLELLDARLLSVITWYHLSFFAVSIAMLGLAGGALAVFLSPVRFAGASARDALPRYALGLALSIAPSHVLNLAIPIPALSGAAVTMAVVSFVISTIALTVPFYLAGIVITLALTRVGERVGRLYAADLLGASFGCLMVVPLIERFDLSTCVLAAAALAALGAGCFERARCGASVASLAVGAALGAAAVANAAAGGALGIVYAKGSHVASGALVELARWNAHSFVVAYKARPARPYYWGPGEGAALAKPRVSMDMLIDGAAGTPLTEFDGRIESLDWVRYDVTALPYHLRHGDVAIVGVGGGRDVLGALWGKSTSIVGVELNGTFVEMLEHSHADFGGLAYLPHVELVHDEGRSWLARTNRRFDVLQMSLVDTWAATGAGAYTLSENGLYTLEAWRLFLSRLKPGGVLSVSRWFSPDNVSEATRLVALATAALLDRGVEDPRARLALVARGNVATLMASPDPLGASDLATLDAVAREYGFAVLVAPGKEPSSALLAAAAGARSHDELARAIEDPRYDYSPPTDARPYFFNLLRLSSFHRLPARRPGVIAGNVQATATLVLLFVVAAVLVAVLIAVPLVRSGRPRMSPGVLAAAIAYFAAIGAGFMLLQMALLQRFSVFLGRPAYAYSVVLFTMIAAAGVGSLASERVAAGSKGWRLVLPLLAAAWAAAVAAAVPPLLEAAFSLETTARVAITAAVIAPGAFVLGFFFPLGLRLVARVAPEANAWMWGINGACGVLASIAAVAISMSLGIHANLLAGAAVYLSIVLWAALLARASGRR